MKDFAKMMFKKGLMLIVLVVLIWLVFFLMNYFYPSAFSSFGGNNSLPGQTEEKESIPLRFKIYNLFFRGSIQNSLSNLVGGDSSSTSATSSEDKDKPYIWGAGTSTVIRNKNRLSAEDLYIYPNDKSNGIAKSFKIDGALVKQKGINNFSIGSTITGSISTSYLSSSYFTVYIYDSNGDYLYSILGTGYKDLKNGSTLNITAVNNSISNNSSLRYTGDGFMVIWSDNPVVESILISKIKIN